ncbi:unnamed protein product [Psylliodes chrysocephalus]|uniref:Uncharacterized protein n=1 Tax=Psylliodes chrysocephalus TaxID=3402493 RepID=A0A9P0D3M8_9CUCU|nr:unnamed protein product [Psylliodes chrysocephala]
MALGLQMLHFDQFLKTKSTKFDFLKELIYDDLLEYQDTNLLSSIRSEEFLTNGVLSELFCSYKQYVNRTLRGDHGKTTHYYMIYIQLVNYYVTLSRSMGDFEMFKYIIPKITNLFFMVNQQNYARWCVKYLDNLNNINETHPGLEDDFKKCFFGIKRTENYFSRIPIDLTLEQTINANAARGLSGISHFTNSIAARQRWTKSHSTLAALISHVLDVFGLKEYQDVTADLRPSRIKIYAKQVTDLVNILENNFNPFDSSLGRDNLYNIATAKHTATDVAEFLLNIEKNGDILRKQFINECADNEERFDKPIKKNRVLNFAAAPKTKEFTLGNKVVELRMQRDIFGRMLGISLGHKVDIEKVLAFPLTPLPTSMCHADGTICKTDKAQLVKIFEKTMEDNINEHPLCFDITILDGFLCYTK